MHIFPLPPGLSPKKKIGERGPEVADVLSNSSEMTDVSQSLLGVQLVWSSAKKRGKLLREAASPLLHRFRQLSYVSTLISKTLYNKGRPQRKASLIRRRVVKYQLVLQSVHVAWCQRKTIKTLRYCYSRLKHSSAS